MKQLFTSTIGRKQLVAIGGLGFALFLFTHMAANMLILFDPKAYNIYSHKLISNPLIYVAELGLLALFVGHMVFALILTMKNYCARDKKYAVSPRGKARASARSKTLWFQGLIILVFVILHLITFKFGTYYDVTYDGETMRDLHRLVIEVFQSPTYVVWYLICLVLLLAHLSYGVSSVFQTFGFYSEKNTPIIKAVGWIYSIVVVAGFISQPIYVYFFHQG